MSRAKFQNSSAAASFLGGQSSAKVTLGARLEASFIYMLRIGVSYLLMLIVMTYNCGLFLAVVFGMSLGHFIFRPGQAALAEACCDEGRQSGM